MTNTGTKTTGMISMRALEEHLMLLQAMLEARLPYLRGRCARISRASALLGAVMDLPTHLDFVLSMASRFHDIGLLGVPDFVLLKQSGLTEEERQWVRRHADIGGRLISKLFPELPEFSEAIWYHHERPDGAGQFGLTEKTIPVLPAIIALVEAVEAMANTRPHRVKMTLKEIIEEVKKYAGVQFTRRAVNAFLQCAEEVYAVVAGPMEGTTPQKPVAHAMA
jgi:HD-GYP domain-containing protein (c-di-GMP phosphodiesterase class II)